MSEQLKKREKKLKNKEFQKELEEPEEKNDESVAVIEE